MISRDIRHRLVKGLQAICWIYRTTNFTIPSITEIAASVPRVGCSLTPIDPNNCMRVRDFREASREQEYRGKLGLGEVGQFAESGGRVVGSIWATINRFKCPVIAKGHMELPPHHALIHDVVTAEKFKGSGIGGYMVNGMASVLFHQYSVDGVAIDVNVNNLSSLRMMRKAGLDASSRVLCISVFGKPAYRRALG